jgi:O-glycosyl hydrolase
VGLEILNFELWFKNILAPLSIKITVNDSQKFQSIIGFGGAFTDAAGINLATLSPEAQQNLISSYFGPQGKKHIIFLLVDFFSIF